jgi:hypothetical protein
MIHIKARNAPEAYVEALTSMRLNAVHDNSRNGQVLVMPCPTVLEITNPLERILYDPIRQANPYFHTMEFVWMMAGMNDVRWLEQFNKRYREYAEPQTDLVHGAYGHRWFSHFKVNQILSVYILLRDDPGTRRAVIGMWDPTTDLQNKRDLPCNTHIYLRIVNEKLEMTVCNRSNDLVWGMLGANVVHMTMLQQLLSEALGRECGPYRVFTNNLHVYKNLPNFEDVYATTVVHDPYRNFSLGHRLISRGEILEKFIWDARTFIYGGAHSRMHTLWFQDVARPMFSEYRRRLGEGNVSYIQMIHDEPLRHACQEWEKWHE